MPVVHIVIPCYNEADTLRPCLDRVLQANFPGDWTRRLLVVDDHSDSKTEEIARTAAKEDDRIRVIRHERNLGKGSALRTGFRAVLDDPDEKDVLIIQDADLEYDPNDIGVILEAFESPDVDAVYGDRFHGGTRKSPMGGLHTSVNRGLTRASNLLTGLAVEDMECCYKAIRIPILRRILPQLDEERFGIEPQITAALGRANARIRNTPISYDPRGFKDGKKIGFSDGVRALFVVFRERLRGTSN